MKKWISALSVVGALSLASAASAQDEVSVQCAAGEKCTTGNVYLGPVPDELTCNTGAAAAALSAAQSACMSHGGVSFYNGESCLYREAMGSMAAGWYTHVTWQCND